MHLLPMELYIAVGFLTILANGFAETQWPERIVGGMDVPNGQHIPYQVSLQYLVDNPNRERLYKHYCGGSIISKNHILTAAHCCYGFNPSRMSIVAGVRDLNDPHAIRLAIDGYKIHPNYVQLISSDIAIIKLSSPLPIDNLTMTAIDLHYNEPVPVGSKVILTGWGLRLPYFIQIPFSWPFLQDQLNALQSPTVLQIMSFRTISDSECKFAIEQLSATEMCAKGDFITGACPGDSGGPLVMMTPNGPRQVGLVSYGLFVCGIFNSIVPDVYTRISTFSDWMQESMRSF